MIDSRDYWMTQLRAREIEQATGISLAQQAEMALDEWARLAYGKTPAEAALAALQADAGEANQSQMRYSTSTAPNASRGRTALLGEEGGSRTSPGISLEEAALTDPAAFAQWRASRKSSGENVGIFSGVVSNTAEYRQAAAARAGRNALVQSNVTGPTVPMSREQMVANMRASEAAQLDNRVNRFRGWGR